MIETQLDKSKKLTIFTVSGTITALEFANAVRSFYAGDVTLYALWDLRNGKIESTDNDVWNLARSVSTLNLSSRRGGKNSLGGRQRKVPRTCQDVPTHYRHNDSAI